MMKLDEYRLANDFVVADYGYWIKPDGTFVPVERTHGHLEVIKDDFAFLHLSPSQPDYLWYHEALNAGWVRIIAPSRTDRQFAFQFKALTPRSRQSLIGLLLGLQDYREYVFESSTYDVFATAKDAAQFVRRFANEPVSVTTETWRP